MNTSVDIWVDPICPWAWMTSRWLVEVEKQRPITLNFRAMSLAHLNRDREMPPKYAAIITHGIKPVRALAATRLEYGQKEFRALYEAMGMLFHPGGRGIDDIDNIVVDAVKSLGLPSSISDRMNDTSLDSEVIKEHDAFAVLTRSIHQSNMKEFLVENPDILPMGLNVESEYTVVVRRSKEN